MSHIEIKLQNGDMVHVTAERHGYRVRLWTSHAGIGYLGSYYPKALAKDAAGVVSKNPHCGASTNYKGKDIETGKIRATGPTDSAKKLIPYFLNA